MTRSRPAGRFAAVMLPAAVVLAGVALRFATLGSPSIWYDEAFHVYVSRLDLPRLVQAAAADTLPPLSYILLHGWMALAGQDEAVLRYFVNAWGVLTVPLTYVLGRRLWSREVGLAAALVVAVGPFFLYWSRELRMYSQMTCLGVLYVVAFLHAWRRPAPSRWLALGLALTANLYTHSLSVLLVLALDLYAAAAVVQDRRTLPRLLGLAAAHALAFAGFLPWLLYLPGQMARVLTSFWIYPPEPYRWFLSIANFLTGMDQLGDPVVLPRWLLLATLAAVAIFGIPAALTLAALARARGRAERGPLLLAVLVLFVPILAFYVLAVVRSLYADRALGVSAVALALLAGRVVVAWDRQYRPGLPAALPLLLVVPAYWWALAASHGLNHLPYAEVSRRLGEAYRPGDAVIYNNKASYFPGAFYRSFPEEYFLSHPPGSRWDDLSPVTRGLLGFEETTAGAAVATRAPRVWLVLNGLDAEADLARLVGPLRQGRAVAEAVAWRGDRIWLYRFDRRPDVGDTP